MKRAALALSVTSSFAGIVVVAASAALSLTFSTTRSLPGAVVTIRTGGSGALAGIGTGESPLRVFFIKADEVDPNSPDIGVTSPGDDRLIRLGDLTVDPEGNGTLRFTVPDVPGGEYTTVIHCIPCAPFSGGRELLATGPFPEPFIVLARGSDEGISVSVNEGTLPWELAIVGGVALALAALVGVAVLRHRQRSD